MSALGVTEVTPGRQLWPSSPLRRRAPGTSNADRSTRRTAPLLARMNSQPGSIVAVVISPEAEIAALLRQFLAYDGFQIQTGNGSESLDAVLDHTRPRLVLVDVDHPEAFSAGFIERARGVGAAVVAYSPSRHEREVRQLAAAYNVAAFGLPLRLSRFRDTLRAALVAP
jgi:hypothetical protein